MVETLDDPRREILTIDAVNMDSDNWVFGCKAKNSRLETLSNEELEFEESATTVDRTKSALCENGINLSQNSVIIPSNGKRKTITINLDQIRSNFTHIVVFMAKGMDQLRVSLDVYAARERNLEAKLPKVPFIYYVSIFIGEEGGTVCSNGFTRTFEANAKCNKNNINHV